MRAFIPRFAVRAIFLAPFLGLSFAADLAAAMPDNIPPSVMITCPEPHPLIARESPPFIRILWVGSDPDGEFTTTPVRYKYVLLGPSSTFPPSVAIADPDSLRRYYVNHPDGPWAGWDSTGADTTSVEYSNLIPGPDYVFALIGFDEAGDYSPVFSLSGNLLRFVVTFDGYLGPRLTLSGPGFEHQYPTGGYLDDSSRYVHTDLPENHLVTFQWSAEPAGACGGVPIRWYRWVLDPYDLSDETPRTDEQTDVHHWSQRSLHITTATLGPFVLSNPPELESHRFYVEAQDVIGVRSLGIVEVVVGPGSASVGWAGDGGVTRLSLGRRPNPTRGGALLTLSSVTEANVDVVIADVAGREVARVFSGRIPSGETTLRWDGRDRTGGSLTPGVYWAVARTDGLATRVKLVVTR